MQASLKKWTALVVLVAVALAGYLTWNAIARDPKAPEVSYTLLDGKTLTSQNLLGKVVLVNFWATSCTTCVSEMPHMVQTYDQFAPKGFELVAVSMNYDRPDYVKTFATAGPLGALPFPVAMDTSGNIAKAFHDVRLTPTSFLIDKSGHIVKQYVGPPNFAELHGLISRLLAQQA
ncbi:putative thioredoxin [Thiomonas sp. X19]|uniref:peroxiredoxin family protein n=1 Tax=Thiomonas sp. X19 TaxID=1050370 RepID=UPI000B692364|nr:TlpA disulfide reductase family protein [Thiomonas sp. X19]SCC91606.1 putative thioredoxin [Thiomonas sp. X19]